MDAGQDFIFSKRLLRQRSRLWQTGRRPASIGQALRLRSPASACGKHHVRQAEMTDHSSVSVVPQQPLHILFVEDDARLSAFLQRYFTDQGFVARTASDGTGMQLALAEGRFDVVVLDIGLPGRDDGYALARKLGRSKDMGIIFLSARQEALDRIVALEIGADDFLVKPFEPRELLARVRAVLRRLPDERAPADDADRAAPPGRSVTFDGYVLDLGARTLQRPDGIPMPLTTHEFNLLSALAQRPGRALSRDQLLDLTAGRAWSPYDRSIDMMIAKLRRKIGDTGPNPRRIRTIRGTGYMFSPEP